MIFSQISALYPFKTKIRAIACITGLFIFKIYSYIINLSFDNFSGAFLNASIIVALMVVIFSKEKMDDERVKEIRYFSLKLSFKFMLFVCACCVGSLQIDVQYIAILGGFFYLVVFYLCFVFNPSFVFKELEVVDSKYSFKKASLEGTAVKLYLFLATLFGITFITFLVLSFIA